MEQRKIESRAMGVYYRRRDGAKFTVRVDDALEARRDPENRHDHNAIGLHVQDGERVGWINRRLAYHLAPLMDEGRLLAVRVDYVDGTDVGIVLTGGVVEAYYQERMAYAPIL